MFLSQWSFETHTLIPAWEEFTQTLEAAGCFTLLPLFDKVNAMGIFFEEEDWIKSKFLMTVMTATNYRGSQLMPPGGVF